VVQSSSPTEKSDVVTEDPYFLEENWRDFVDETLDKRKEGQQDALWELLTTEVFYIKRLKVIRYLFHSCLLALQSEGLLVDIEAERMFSNIFHIDDANETFWMRHLLPMLEKAREGRETMDPSLMSEGFSSLDSLFHPYIKYCLEHSACLSYVKEKHKENELFKTYVVWCETRKECQRLRLTDLLVKPMQRLTRYSLLLKAITRKTDDENQLLSLKKMVSTVY
jgi:pleckstrin domain-containing family G protein 5